MYALLVLEWENVSPLPLPDLFVITELMIHDVGTWECIAET